MSPDKGLAQTLLFCVLLFAVALLVLYVASYLAFLPGKIARKRGHPSAQAIGICGIFGLLMWPLWIVAYIWAHSGPHHSRSVPAPRGLACDGCGRPLAIAQARQIGVRLICPACALALDGGPHAPQAEQLSPQAKQLFGQADELQKLAARSHRPT